MVKRLIAGLYRDRHVRQCLFRASLLLQLREGLVTRVLLQLVLERPTVLVGDDFGLPIRPAGRRPLVADLELIEVAAIEDRNLAWPDVADGARLNGRDADADRHARRQVQVLIGDELRTAVDAHRGALRQRELVGPLADHHHFAVRLVLANRAIGRDRQTSGDVHRLGQERSRQRRIGSVGCTGVGINGDVD